MTEVGANTIGTCAKNTTTHTLHTHSNAYIMSLAPVFDHLQYAKLQVIKNWMVGRCLDMSTINPTKATIYCILVSHQELSLKFVQVGSHYHYAIICQPQQSSAPGLARPRSL